MYGTSHKRLFVPVVGGNGLICNVKAQLGSSQYCESSGKVTNWVTDASGWFCGISLKGLWLEGGNLEVSPK